MFSEKSAFSYYGTWQFQQDKAEPILIVNKKQTS